MLQVAGTVGHTGSKHTNGCNTLGKDCGTTYQSTQRNCCLYFWLPLLAQLPNAVHMAVINILASSTSQDPLVMHLLRTLHFIAAFYNLHLIAKHIAGSNNSIADAISHNLPQGLFSQAPEADPQPTPIPEPLWDILVIRHPDWLSDICMANIANSLVDNSLAPNSRKTYSSTQARYLNFCSRMHLNPLPANQQQLILFAADLSQTIAYSSMRTYLSAVRHLHISAGYEDPLRGSMQLDLLMRGARKTKPTRKDYRLPITPLILSHIYEVLNQHPDSYGNKLLGQLVALGFSPFSAPANSL